MNTNYTMDTFNKLLNTISNNWIYYVAEGTKEVVGTDKVRSKINIDGYLYIVGNTNKEDICMIGDNIDIDIKGAKDASIKSILIDFINRHPNYNNRITDIKELMNIL